MLRQAHEMIGGWKANIAETAPIWKKPSTFGTAMVRQNVAGPRIRANTHPLAAAVALPFSIWLGSSYRPDSKMQLLWRLESCCLPWGLIRFEGERAFASGRSEFP